jgi:hypothetical protein
MRVEKPRFKPFEIWAACPRCNARVPYDTLKRERLTGLLVCSPASGRPVKSCWDPWPDVYDFQAYPDKSIEPPPEPYPLRYGLDNVWGNGPATGNTATFAKAPVAAPDDATRLNALLTVPYYKQLGVSAAFVALNPPLSEAIRSLTTIVPAEWDGTFIPSSSVRTVTPPDEATELKNVNASDNDVTASISTPPWATVKGV